MSKLVFASVISEIQQSDVFMTVKARICEAPEANLNGARVTEAFIDEIVGNEKRYVGLPLYADVKALTNGNYNRLGHLYDVRTGEFHSTQIGSFYKFEKQKNGETSYLVGYARIPKRNKKLSKAISELFADGALKFSFELSVGEYEELDDDTILIDASENNYLEGTAIVTYPACEDAVALELVAQKNTDESRKGESEMAEVENKAEVVETEAAQPELAEEEEEKVEAEETVEESEDETAACKKKKAETETATVYIEDHTVEVHEQSAYDSETGKSINQRVVVETVSSQPTEGTLVETVDGAHVAEVEIAEGDGDGAGEGAGETPATETTGTETTGTETPGAGGTETPGAGGTETSGGTGGTSGGGSGGGSSQTQETTPADLIPEETNQDSYDSAQKKTAEQMIAELLETVAQLKAEIEELKVKPQTMTAEVNPFMGDINTKGKYTLLESDSAKSQYTLL